MSKSDIFWGGSLYPEGNAVHKRFRDAVATLVLSFAGPVLLVRRDFIERAGSRLNELKRAALQVNTRAGNVDTWAPLQWESGDLLARFYVACLLWTNGAGWETMARWYGLSDAEVRYEFAALYARGMAPTDVKEIISNAAAIMVERGYEHTPLSYDEIVRLSP